MSDRPQIAQDDAATVAAAAEAGEPDRYLAALLARPPQREALLALAALAAELGRIPFLVREPQGGVFRLQWWRDALARAAGERTGHPVADAVREAAVRHGLPAGLLDGLVEAQVPLLHADPFADEATLDDYLWKAEGAQFALACQITGIAYGAQAEAACRASGQAYGLARLLLGLPRTLSTGRIPLAQTRLAEAELTAEALLADPPGAPVAGLLAGQYAQIRANLTRARRFVAGLPRPGRIAFLPLALVGPYVRSLERRGGMALREEAGLLPLTRVCRIAAAHVTGRL